MARLNAADALRALEEARTIAVIGAHTARERPAFYVPEYLHNNGYRVLPVNSRLVGQALFAMPFVASVADIEEPVDLIDVFRRSEDVLAHVDEILAMRTLPKVVWLQLGIRNDEAGDRIVAAGIDFVQDRCTLADHKAYGLPRR